MIRLRQFASALMILTLLTVLNAPLLACQQAGHKCAMMTHAATPAAPMAMANHACCHGKSSEPANVPAKKRCHETAALMAAGCTAASKCCDMNRTPAVNVVGKSVPVRKVILAAASYSPHEPLLLVQGRAEWHETISLFQKPVFELKTDLRI